MTLKRHSKILAASSDIKEEKLKKLGKQNLFKNWHMMDDCELNMAAAFYVKTFRESVNVFIIR